MGSKKRNKFRKKRKHLFYGNVIQTPEPVADPAPSNEQHTPTSAGTPTNTPISSASLRKLVNITPSKQRNNIPGNRIIDMSLLSDVFNLLSCPECHGKSLLLTESIAKKKGSASYFMLSCESCKFKHEFCTSKTVGKCYEVNIRLTYAMRSIGNSHSGAETFCMLMNIPKPMTAKNYRKVMKHCSSACKTVAEELMADAATELRNAKGVSAGDSLDVPVSCDGTWQRRGYVSHNGIMNVISMDTGKILDTESMCKFCKVCSNIEKLKETNIVEYETRKANHSCSINYRGSSSGMEVEGAVRIFERSLEKHDLRYTHITISKLECIGHVQKRVGTRLRKLKKNNKGLGGKGKLTDHIIDKLQNFYGIAIRQNVGDLQSMKKAVVATLFHVASSEKNKWHDYCPTGADSWCKFQRSKVDKTVKYKPGAGIPVEIVLTHLKPIYNDLSSDSLLSKCLHGKTQNQNEAFNKIIWDRVPKTSFCTKEQLEFGLYDAVSNFNIGRKATVLIFEKLGVTPGKFLINGCREKNRKRLYHADYKFQSPMKKRRKLIRGVKKQKQDKNKASEGKLYEAGGF